MKATAKERVLMPLNCGQPDVSNQMKNYSPYVVIGQKDSNSDYEKYRGCSIEVFHGCLRKFQFIVQPFIRSCSINFCKHKQRLNKLFSLETYHQRRL